MNSRAIALAALVGITVTSATAVAEEEEPARGLVAAFEVGAGGVSGSGPTVYGLGTGKSFILGYRMGKFTAEWHFAQSYRMAPREAVLKARGTEGDLGLSTVALRYTMQRRSYLLTTMGGAVRATVPLLSLVTDEFGGEPTIASRNLVGIGAIAGAGFGVPILKGQAQIFIEGRVAYAMWEQPEYFYVAEVEAIDETSLTFIESADDVRAIPWTVCMSLRVIM